MKLEIVTFKTTINDEILTGELEFSSKDFTVRLIEPFYNIYSSHLQYSIPVKYVLTKSQNPSCIEIELLEQSKEILVGLYLKKRA